MLLLALQTFFLSCAWAFFPDSPFSRDAAGTTSAGFLKIPVGARAVAMGEAQVAAVEGSESIFWNPARLVSVPRLSESGSEGLPSCGTRLRSGSAGSTCSWDPASSEVSSSYNALLETTFQGTLSYARLLSEENALGVGWIFFSQDSIESFNTVGDPTGDFTPYDFSLAVALARAFQTFSAGVTLKGIRSKIAGESDTGFAADIGFFLPKMDEYGKVDFGVSLMNLGPEFGLGSEKDPLPFRARFGGAIHFSPQLTAALDLNLPADNSPFVALGAEYLLLDSQEFGMALRAGFNSGNLRGIEGFSGISAGGGWRVRRFSLDYAWNPFGDLGSTHRVSLSYRF
ncbi:MAG: PorV/PorQ family protein [Elusimicrobia bacterium]|nr:PorV/PorQ family protein [Elusimicrobiota bacterium]